MLSEMYTIDVPDQEDIKKVDRVLKKYPEWKMDLWTLKPGSKRHNQLTERINTIDRAVEGLYEKATQLIVLRYFKKKTVLYTRSIGLGGISTKAYEQLREITLNRLYEELKETSILK